MINTHTPGPWTVDGHYILSRCGNYHLTFLTNADVDQIEEWKANASLISAAPELLEALEMLMAQEPSESCNVNAYDRACWQYANEAISKAKA